MSEQKVFNAEDNPGFVIDRHTEVTNDMIAKVANMVYPLPEKGRSWRYHKFTDGIYAHSLVDGAEITWQKETYSQKFSPSLSGVDWQQVQAMDIFKYLAGHLRVDFPDVGRISTALIIRMCLNESSMHNAYRSMLLLRPTK